MSLFFAFISLALSLAFFGEGFKPVFLVFYLVSLFFSLLLQKKKGFVISVAFFLLGCLLFFLIPQNFTGAASVRGIVIRAENNWILLKTFWGSFYLGVKGNSYEEGDILAVSGAFSPFSFTHYQESFDFARYLNSEGVFVQIRQPEVTSLFQSLIRLKAYKKSLESSYSASVLNLILSLVFGDGMSKGEGVSSFYSLGLSYLFSSSGLHIAFLCSLLKKALEKKLSEKKTGVICLAVSVLASSLQGLSLSGLRLILMWFFSLLGVWEPTWKRPYSERLSLAGLICLLFRPLYVLDGGFLFTYPVLFLFGFARSLAPRRERNSRLRMALMFFFLLLPLNMKETYGFSPLSLGFDLLLSPLFSFLYVLDLSVFLGPLTVPFLEKVNAGVMSFFPWLAKTDLLILCGEVSWVCLVCFYALMLLIMYTEELGLKKARLFLTWALVLLFLISFIPDFRRHYEVDFLDVGQGDATLVRYGKENILIDTGGSKTVDLAQECLIPYFRRKMIYQLDLVLTTHDDFDHVGALDSLKSSFPIGKIVKGGEQGILDMGGLLITDLNAYRYEGEESNYGSAVYSFKIHNTSFLIMGDAPQAIERKILADHPALTCDVLKVGHHGSDTSSSFEFLQAVKPSLAIISCGVNNIYGHPSSATLASLTSLSIPYVRTDRQGTYVYRIS
jgi:competence protein ComEC